EAEKVIDCQMTSSPIPTPHSTKANCKAAVPAESAATCTSSFKNRLKSSSKPFTFGPKGATQLASNASWIYFNSLPPIWGEDNHILSFMDYFFNKITYNLDVRKNISKFFLPNSRLGFTRSTSCVS